MGPEPSMAPPVVDLPDSAVLNWGHHRTCFVHPLDPRKCIKVPLPGGSLDQCLVEHDYYRHLARRQRAARPRGRLPRLGRHQPGRGLVFDRIEYADGDDPSSVNLERAIATKLLGEEEIESGLRELVTYLRDTGSCGATRTRRTSA